MASITCRHGGTQHTHDSVLDVKICQGVVATAIDYERMDQWREASVTTTPDPFHSNKLNRATATAVAEREDTRVAFVSEKASVVGIYLVNGDYYKVQKNREGTQLYAKKGAKSGDKWSWRYAKGAIYNIKANHLLTSEQASEFGKLWSICINCFSELSREESMNRGYGPTCADNYGWPYDHSAN